MPAIEAEFRTARQMKDLLASRKASALELLDLHLERVGKLNPVFNAVVVNLWRPKNCVDGLMVGVLTESTC